MSFSPYFPHLRGTRPRGFPEAPEIQGGWWRRVKDKEM